MLLALEVKVLYTQSMYYFIQRMFEMFVLSFLLDAHQRNKERNLHFTTFLA